MPYGDLPEVATTTGQSLRGVPIHILNSPTGEKTAICRLPTTDELLKYLAAQRAIMRDFGRGVTDTKDLPTPKADLALFTALRLDKGPESVEFDEAEALYALTIVLKHKVTSTERVGQNFVVTIATLFGDTTHTVRIPYHSELAEYRQHAFAPRSLPNNIEEHRFPPEVPVSLYDKIIVGLDGYVGIDADSAGPRLAPNGYSIIADCVPPHHKRSVIYSVNSALTLLDPALDPNS